MHLQLQIVYTQREDTRRERAKRICEFDLRSDLEISSIENVEISIMFQSYVSKNFKPNKIKFGEN